MVTASLQRLPDGQQGSMLHIDSFIIHPAFRVYLLCAEDRGWCWEHTEKPDLISVLWEITIQTKVTLVLESQDYPNNLQWLLLCLLAYLQ